MFNTLWFAPDGGAAKYLEYLQAIAPLLQKYEGQPIAAYTPVEAVEGNFNADMFGVVEWPSRDAFQQFFEDPEYQEFAHLRKEATKKAWLVAMHSHPQFPIVRERDEVSEKVYLLNALWFKPNGGAQMYQNYLNATAPISKKYGTLPVEAYIPAESLEGDFLPHMVGIVEWPSEDAFGNFFYKDSEYQRIAPQRETALVKAYLVMAKQLSLAPTNENKKH